MVWQSPHREVEARLPDHLGSRWASGSVGGGGGAGLAGAVEASSNGGGHATEIVGIATGGFGMRFLGGPIVIVPLVCK